MKRLNKFKGMYALLVVVAAVIGITIYGSCSADGDFWGFDEECALTENTRAEKKDMSEYLTLSTYNSKEWSSKDYDILTKAIGRIGVSFSETKHCYEFNASSGKQINISDSLYNRIIGMFEYTNGIINSKTYEGKARKKMMRGEGSIVYSNCVPMAISHMGQGAPTYATAVDTCNHYCHNWQSQGGVNSNLVGPIIRKFVLVHSYLPTQLLTYTNPTFMNYCVALIYQNGVIDHAVNVTYCNPDVNNPNKRVIYYDDYCSGETGKSVYSTELTSIYPFQ